MRTFLRHDVCPTTDASNPELLSAKPAQTAHDFSPPVVRAVLRNDEEYDLKFIPWMTRCKDSVFPCLDTIGYGLPVGSYALGTVSGHMSLTGRGCRQTVLEEFQLQFAPR